LGNKKITSTVRAPRQWDDVVAAFEHDLLRKGRSAETIRAYRSSLNQFAGFYKTQLKKNGPYLSRLQETDFFAFSDYLRSTLYLAVSSINRTVAALHTFSRFLLEMRWARRDIAKGLRTYYIEGTYEPKRFSAGEIRRLVTSVDLNSVNGYRDYAILQLFLQCGLRLGELIRLSMNDVTIGKKKGKIKIRDEKTQAQRMVPLNASARRALANHLDRRGEMAGDAPLFVSTRGTRISSKTVQYLVKKYLCAAGRADLSVGDLRHHFALKLYEKRKSLPIVQRVLGHRHLATTSRYIKPSQHEIATAVEELPDNVYHGEPMREVTE
jgi:integrase/recombinase XerC